MRYKLLMLLLTISIGAVSIKAEAQITVEPKINLAMAAVTVFNPAVEIGFGERSAVQLEYFGAYSKSNFMGTGSPLIMNVSMIEYRRYLLNREHRGFFAGANFGTQMYKMSKNVIPIIGDDIYKGYYDWGFGVVIGLHLGYKFVFQERIGLEFSAAGGWQRSQHERYLNNGELNAAMNATGEWFPYKLGISLSYRFGEYK